MSFDQPEVAGIREQAAAFAREISDPQIDLPRAWESLRATPLPFIPILFRHDLEVAHRLCSNVLCTIGESNLGMAYALENHLYVLGALETYLAMHPSIGIRARLDRVLAERQYIANTHGYVHADGAFTEGITAKATNDGMIVNGLGHFVSLAGTADLLLLTLVDCPDPVALLFPLQGDRRIEFGSEYHFPSILPESDTRAMKCEGVLVPHDCVLDVARDHLLPGGAMSAVQLGWHLTLSASVFLGGTSYVLDQSIHFAKTFKAFDGRPLARLDDVVATLGDSGVRYGAASALVNEYSRSIASVLASIENRAGRLKDGLFRAQVASCHATELAEEISRRCRRLMGTRVFGPEHAKLTQVTTELLLGPLTPRNNGILVKDVGYGMLAKKSFDGARWVGSFEP